MLVFGPACGFILGSFCTKIYVDAVFIDTSKESPSVSNHHPQAFPPWQRSRQPGGSKTVPVSGSPDPSTSDGQEGAWGVGSEGPDSGLCSASVRVEAG